jgi:hypothetical protein
MSANISRSAQARAYRGEVGRRKRHQRLAIAGDVRSSFMMLRARPFVVTRNGSYRCRDDRQ